MRNVIYLGAFLMIICAISAGALAVTNEVTAPLIEAHQEASGAAAVMAEVLPAAATFEDIADEVQDLLAEYPDVDGVSVGFTDGGSPAGHVFSVSPTGYGDVIVMLVGISDDGIVGVHIVQQTETPGLGSLIATEDFCGQFDSLPNDAPVALSKDGGEVDAVAGATVSSRAVVTGVEQARKLYLEITGER
ncbi:MAG: RnfABCDGE type electron transport complex subunit G [Bacillota bacterium]